MSAPIGILSIEPKILWSQNTARGSMRANPKNGYEMVWSRKEACGICAYYTCFKWIPVHFRVLYVLQMNYAVKMVYFLHNIDILTKNVVKLLLLDEFLNCM